MNSSPTPQRDDSYRDAAECPSPQRIQALLDDALTATECDEIERHLSECSDCRTRLEGEFGIPEWWPPANNSSDIAGDDELSDSGTACENFDWISLLGPTDDPRMLGRIGSYEIVGLLGRGGMGVVFKALDCGLQRYVAIKILAPHLAASGASRQRFAREAQAAAAVVDDHVLPIYGVDQWRGIPYLVMQYSRGITLQKRISEQGRLEFTEALRIGLQIAKGLSAAHAQGLVHRDVKPSNILLDGNVERVLLTDFGLARAVDDANLTHTGTIAGTPQFMSPEQVRGEAVDHRSDLFSLGCVLYTMCTGQPPFRASSSYAILRQVTDQEPRPVRELNPQIPEWFAAIIARLMAKSTQHRFSSAAETTELLEQCLAHVQQPLVHALPAAAQTSSIPGPRLHPPSRAALSALAIVLLIALLQFGNTVWRGLFGSDSSKPPSASPATQASLLPNATAVKTAEWIKITAATTHANYLFVDLEWEVSVLPCYERTIFLGPSSSFSQTDIAIARDHQRSGVECSVTNPVSAHYILGSDKRGSHRLFFRLPDKVTAEQALSQLKDKQSKQEREGLQGLYSDQIFALFRVEHGGKWYQGGIDILPGVSESGKESLCLLYTIPYDIKLRQWKILDHAASDCRLETTVRWEPTALSKISSRVFTLSAGVTDEEIQRVNLLAQRQIEQVLPRQQSIDTQQATTSQAANEHDTAKSFAEKADAEKLQWQSLFTTAGLHQLNAQVTLRITSPTSQAGSSSHYGYEIGWRDRTTVYPARSYGPLTRGQEPFVAYWDESSKRLWLATPSVIIWHRVAFQGDDATERFDHPTEIPIDIVNILPAEFSKVIARWYPTTTPPSLQSPKRTDGHQSP